MAVSVSMCTRVYSARGGAAAMDVPCKYNNWGINTTFNFCNSLRPYSNPTIDATQNVVVGRTSANNMLSTFESQITINSKFCDINKMYGNLDLGLALYDLECEDWGLVCPPRTAGIHATNRFGKVSQHTHKLANDGVASACT
ncbi:uncharacterized protein LOC142802757 [Rhipicephalus microplus]|uniref:uncharacterized protein LOC142802757 n=1 Tax=Rhipicephalus microplus TaxID=6941 RepID=UPI003F6AFBE7